MTKANDTATDTKAGDPHTYSFVAEEFLKGSIDEVSAALGERSFAELDALHGAEESGGKRTGMLGAIDRERDARGTDADTALEAARTAHERAGRKIYTDADFDDATKQALTDAETAKAGQADLQKRLDAMAADHETATSDLQKQIETLTAERDQARAAADEARKGAAPAAPSRKKAPKPRLFEMDDEAEVDLSTATTVAFGDTRGVSFPAIEDLQFGPGDFLDREGGTRQLQQAIDFDGTEQPAEISAAYLLDKSGKAVAVSPFYAPVQVGGGRKASLPAGTLLFRREQAPSPLDAAKAAQA